MMVSDCGYQSMYVRKNKKPSACGREEETEPVRQKECLKLKEKLRGEKQMGAAVLGNDPV